MRDLLPYGEVKIVKTLKAFKRYARNYSVQVIDSKYPSVQLTVSRSSIKDLFKDLIAEIEAFKYQTTLKVLLSKYNKMQRENLLTFILIPLLRMESV